MNYKFSNFNYKLFKMKHTILVFASAIFIASCGGNKEGGDKAAQLAELQKQEAEIAKKIQAIEAELGLSEKKESKVTLVKVEELLPTEFKHFVDVQGHVDATENVIANVKSAGGIITKIHVNSCLNWLKIFN